MAEDVKEIEPTGDDATQDDAPQDETSQDVEHKTIAEDAEGSDAGQDAPLDEKDWRDLVAGGDEKFRKQLNRYASLEGLGKKVKALESKLSSGEMVRI